MGKTIRLQILFLLALIPFGNLSAQTQKFTGLHWSVFVLKSPHLESTNQENDVWSHFGLGANLEYQFESGLGLEGRLSYRKWDRYGFDKLLIPFTVGPSFRYSPQSKFSFSAYCGIGPSVVGGNDYLGGFANIDAGLRFGFARFFLGAGFGQGMAFHPGAFEYLDLFIGFRF